MLSVWIMPQTSLHGSCDPSHGWHYSPVTALALLLSTVKSESFETSCNGSTVLSWLSAASTFNHQSQHHD